MAYFSFQRIFWVILILVVLALGFGFGRLFAFPDSSWPLDKGERVTLAPGETLIQPFMGSRDGLRRVEILFGKFSLLEDDVLTLELRDTNCTNVLAKETFKKQSFDSEYTYSFLFNRIKNSKNQLYCVAFTFESNRKVTKEKAPRFFVDRSAQQPAYIIKSAGGETASTQATTIRPGYTNDSFFANADELFDRMSQYKPWFLKSWYLITFAVFGLILTLVVTTLLIKENEEEL